MDLPRVKRARLRWSPLPRGGFTGIEWSRPGATDGCDPYLVWAETDGFAGYGQRPPKWLPLLIELAEGVSLRELAAAASAKWLYLPRAYLARSAPAGLRFCSARVRPGFFRELEAGGRLHGLVRRFEMGLPAGQHADDPTEPAGAAQGGLRPDLKGPVLGLIDGGLAFAHANFLRQRGTRIRHFWRQDRQGQGEAPADFDYGHVLTAAEIDAAMRANTFGGLVDETRVYRQFDMGMELDKHLNHGTHVLDVAAGPRDVEAQVAGIPPDLEAPPTWALARDTAASCDIVAVQLDWDTVLDTSGGSMNVHIMDALMFMLARCTTSARLAVNLSWGTLAGPHDGSALLESAMDQLVGLLGPERLQIVLPAGNGYQSRTHANATLAPGGEAVLHWRVQPADPTQSFVELWFPPGAQGLAVEITPPGRDPLPPLALGDSGCWRDAQGRAVAALIFPRTVATGLNGTSALLAVAPTFSFEEKRALAPAGSWQIRVVNGSASAVTFDAYVERDDEIVGVRSGARQSHFEDALYDTSGNPGSFVDHADNPTLIRRSGTFNSIGTGRATRVVGGTRLVPADSWARYSPRNPDPDPGRTQRPDLRIVPPEWMPSDENLYLRGLKAAGSRSGGVARMAGTSDAAPQLTRKLLNLL